jgi:hypothetical protein
MLSIDTLPPVSNIEPESYIPVPNLNDEAHIRVRETHEIINISLDKFNNMIKTQKELVKKFNEKNINVQQNMQENVQTMIDTTEQVHNNAQNTLDNITNPENLNLFTNLFNFLARSLGINVNLITYGVGAVIGVTVLIGIGNFIFRYNVLSFFKPTTAILPPSITTETQPSQASTNTFFSRIGERIIKLVDLFIEKMSKIEYRKYK